MLGLIAQQYVEQEIDIVLEKSNKKLKEVVCHVEEMLKEHMHAIRNAVHVMLSFKYLLLYCILAVKL